MAKLEDYIAPGEPILWRTRSYWQTMKGQLWPPAGFMAFGVLLQLLSADRDFFGILFWLPLIWMTFVAAYPFGDWSEVFLTERRLVFLRRFRRPRIQAMERSEIRELEIFAGAGLMVVHGRRESLQPVCFIGESLGLARELDLPTRLWKPQDPPTRPGRWRVLRVASWFVVPAVMLVFIAIFVGVSVVAIKAYPDWQAVRSTFVGDLAGLVIGAVFILSAGGGFLAGQVVMGGLRRLLLPKTDMMRLRCVHTDPLRLGEMPRTAKQSRTVLLWRALEDSYYRLAYGPHSDCEPPEPELYEPGAFPPPENEAEGEATAPS